jgi:ribulose-bisphosphate carboxylase large chain
VTSRLIATYTIRCPASDIDARARAIAVEQSVEMPLAAITDDAILADIVGQVAGIVDQGDGTFAVRIALATSTTGAEPGQLMNMLFGNSSIHDDVVLQHVEFPALFAAQFSGPNVGLAGLRARADATHRALTCSALKPLGQSPTQLAALASRLALGGLDYIKDDHGLADQAFSPFAGRVGAIATALRSATASTGKTTCYVPSVSGNLDALRTQVAIARDHGIETVLIAPMVTGLASFATLVRENRDLAFIAHPAMAGASRIAPALLLGKLFPLFGADGVVFPNSGGRFGYTRETCRAVATAARSPEPGHIASCPIPAGGMTSDRVPEILALYGRDVMLLIGGDLLAQPHAMTARAAALQRMVETFVHTEQTQ